jgi:hypothetical protein
MDTSAAVKQLVTRMGKLGKQAGSAMAERFLSDKEAPTDWIIYSTNNETEVIAGNVAADTFEAILDSRGFHVERVEKSPQPREGYEYLALRVVG